MHLAAIQKTVIREVHEDVAELVNALDYFTCGRCWELAEAMAELFQDGRIVEIRVSNGSWNMLVHAGLEIGPHVVDIEGLHERETWIERWSAAWEDPEIVLRARRGDTLGYENFRTKMIARHFARLVARSTVVDTISDPGMKKAA